ncbi:MAG TPA: thioesterase family protein [Thermoanaerobaculia bacterium]|nr:thioesterase family protein [Thermoanaerobaculia bacterium]
MRQSRSGSPALRGFRLRLPVRFSECDLYGVVWHGRYAVYLEELRNAVSARFDWSVVTARDAGYLIPITRMEIAYHAPARFGSTLEITGRLRPPEVARFVFDYEIRDGSGARLTSATTEQVVTRLDGELLVALPRRFRDLAEAILAGQDDDAVRDLTVAGESSGTGSA